MNLVINKKMKTKTMKLILIAVVAISSLSVKAQDDTSVGKYGKDSAECVKNISLYREFFRQNNFKDAYSPWQWTFCNCPQSSMNIMINGPQIINEEIKSTKDENRKHMLLDSLFLVYDTRIALYPNTKGAVLGRKANEYITHIPKIWDAKYKAEKDTIKKNAIRDTLAQVWENAFNMYEESVTLEGNNTSPSVINAHYQTAEKYMLYRNKETTLMFDTYDKGSDIIEYNLDKAQTQFGLAVNLIDSLNAQLAAGSIDQPAFNKQLEKLTQDTLKLGKTLASFEKAKNNFDLLFTPYAKCQDIENIYKKKFNENPDDIALLEKITKIMNKKKCTTSELFLNASTKLYALKPTAESAFLVGIMNFSKNDYAKAKDYFEDAIKLFADEESKAQAYIMTAFSCSALKQYGLARTYAYKYAALKPGDGTPYILIGDMYAQSASSCGSDELTSRAANWAAVDKYMKARAIDSGKTAEANKRISAAASRFPTSQAVFFNSLTKGQSYTVGCWINETTTVR